MIKHTVIKNGLQATALATALTLGHCTVVTTDSDFTAIPGLAVANWTATA